MLQDGTAGPIRRQVLPWNKMESKVEKRGYHISHLSLHAMQCIVAQNIILGLETQTARHLGSQHSDVTVLEQGNSLL